MAGRVTVVKYLLAAATELDAETAGATVDGVAQATCGPSADPRSAVASSIESDADLAISIGWTHPSPPAKLCVWRIYSVTPRCRSAGMENAVSNLRRTCRREPRCPIDDLSWNRYRRTTEQPLTNDHQPGHPDLLASSAVPAEASAGLSGDRATFATRERSVTEYTELNWTISMSLSATTLRTPYHGMAFATLD